MQRRETAIGLIGYLFIGTAAVLIPSVMPRMTEEFLALGLSLSAIGLVFPARAVGGIAGNLIAGIGADLAGSRQLIGISSLLLALSLALTAYASQWILFLLGLVLVSAAQGALGTGINALVADANRGARGRALNVLHGVYGAGAAVSPLLFGYMLGQGVAWRWALTLTAAIWLLYTGVVIFAQGKESGPSVAAAAPALDFTMLRAGPILALFAVAFIYNGVATSLLGWIAVFMQTSAGYSTFWSVATITVFYVALTAGRFLCAFFAERTGYAMTLLILGAGITLTYPLVLVEGEPFWTVAGIFLSGLSLSGLFPTALALGARAYPQQTGTFSGTLSVAMSIGATIPPLWTGFFAELWGLRIALALNYLMVPPLLVLALYLHRMRAVR